MVDNDISFVLVALNVFGIFIVRGRFSGCCGTCITYDALANFMVSFYFEYDFYTITGSILRVAY